MPVLVKDIMSSPLTVDLNKTVKAAGVLMRKNRIGSLIVTKSKKPVGILTDSDIIKKVVAKDIKPSKLKVKDTMSSPLVIISPAETMLDATRKMKKNNIKRLPVVSNGKLVGVITLSDIAKTSPEMTDLLEYRLKMRQAPAEITEKFTSGICDSCGVYFEHLENANGKWLCETCKDELESR